MIYGKVNGLPRIRVYEQNFQQFHDIPLPEPLCEVEPGVNKVDNCKFAYLLKITHSFFLKMKDPAQKFLRFSYSSLLTPGNTYDYDLTNRTLQLLYSIQTKEVLTNYVCHRVSVPSHDLSVSIPLTLLHKKELLFDSKYTKCGLSPS